MISLLDSLGFVVHSEKLIFIPSQVDLGCNINSVTITVTLTIKRKQKLKEKYLNCSNPVILCFTIDIYIGGKHNHNNVILSNETHVRARLLKANRMWHSGLTT